MARFVTGCTWDEVPHLSTEEKDELWAAVPPHERSARSKGIPALGSGLIYPFEESSYRIDPLPKIPREWPRCFGLDSDAGAGWTAIVWMAWDRDHDTVYVTKSYKSQSREKAVHIEAARQMGLWIPGVGDAAGLLVTEHDSMQLIELYRGAGMDIELPDKAVSAGLQAVYDRLALGQLKIYSTCTDLLEEMRQYHRKDGKVVKVNDHCCDSLRYGVFSGLARSRVQPIEQLEPQRLVYDMGQQGTGWMGG